MSDAEASSTEAVWRAFGDQLFAWFAARTSREEAEELLQECFLRIHRGLPTLREETLLGAWVRQVARNVWVDSLRMRSSEPLELESLEPGAVDSGVDRAENEEESPSRVVASWLEAFLEELSADDRQVLRWIELEGLPHRVVAERLGLSGTAVKARARRARARLRDRLERCCEIELDARGEVRGARRRGTPRCDDCG